MNSFTLWLEATRPKTLIASLHPVLIGSLFAYQTHCFSLVLFLFTLCTALGLQISTNFANDYFDYINGADTKHRKGPRRMVQSGAISQGLMKKGIVISFLITALLSGYLIYKGGLIIGYMMVISILLGLGYTTGPFRLAYLGLGDLFVCLFFGPIATGFTYYLQTHQFSMKMIGLGLSPGLLSTAILVVNNLRDSIEDRYCNKNTLCVRFGESFCKLEYTLSVLTAASIPCFYGYYLPLFTAVLALPSLQIVWFSQEKILLNHVLEQTGKLSIVFYLLLSFSVFFKQYI